MKRSRFLANAVLMLQW